MGQFYETIPESLIKWIQEQKMFWVSTAPLSGSGHVNVSPKGGLYFGVLGDATFWYMDLTGSGNETISHLYEPGNGRITVMFTAFEGPPRIVRLFGRGRVLENGTSAFSDFVEKQNVKTIPGSRSIILVDVHQVGSSCGYSVPYYDFKTFRTTLNDVFAKRVEKLEENEATETMEKYWAYKNAWSMDGLPGLEVGRKMGEKQKIAPMGKMVGRVASQNCTVENRFGAQHLILVVLATALLTATLILQGPQLTRQLVALRV
ncbi:hypothetical protein B0T25DRAFT_186091 [Lasiosphaeria hispida]|uniref:Pyridoxamine 5'-phosphate oxidase putative domain-containing protein n=1 Tax=Lasiosphaeria hispida TaxID=260671 RepID=A0AAJ0HGZ5_9PEZI|nr:hypothetical protein B0T25DRAFT_186091 [Lasiosphaeria hispida]